MHGCVYAYGVDVYAYRWVCICMDVDGCVCMCRCVYVYVCVHVFMGIAATLQDSIKIIRGMGMVLQPPETWPSRGRFRTEVRGLCCPHLCDSICHLGHSSTPRALSLLKSPVLIALLFSSLCKAQT